MFLYIVKLISVKLLSEHSVVLNYNKYHTILQRPNQAFRCSSCPLPAPEHHNTLQWCCHDFQSEFLQVGLESTRMNARANKTVCCVVMDTRLSGGCTRQHNLICHLEMKTVNSRTAVNPLETHRAPKDNHYTVLCSQR